VTATFALPGAIASARSRFQRIRAIPVWGTLFLAVVGYLVLIEGVLQLAYGKIDIPFVDIGFLEIGFGERAIPREVFLQSAVVGALYALVAMGLIVVYRANQVINFAQAQLGAVPAVIAALLIARQQTPYLLVLPIVLLGSALLGAGVEVTIIRRFSSAPRLILTVATIGVGLLLVVLEFYAKVWIPGELLDGAGDRIPTPFDALSFRLGVVTFTGNHIAAVVITGVLVAAFGAFFRYTDLGIAVRASAENANRASLLGIPVRRVSTIVWVMASVLSAVAVFLRIPLIGLNLGGSISLAVLQFGLVAAAMAKFDDLPLALLSGVFISVVT
jgi:branched-chain amino acid transport system permease protein